MNSHPGRFEHVTFASALPEASSAPAEPAPLQTPAPVRAAGRPHRPEPAVEIPDEELDLLALVFRLAELDLGCYRLEPLSRRVPACLRALRASSAAQALDILCRRPALLAKALDALLIGVSSFFRDLSVFEQIREMVIPELLASREGLRVWSVGCADGAELYSVAMILADCGVLHASSLLGTDCRSAAVLRARQGTFHVGAEVLPQETGGHLVRLRGHLVRVTPDLRGAVRFERADALSEPVEGLFDLILCRNMSIYLVRPAAEALWARLTGALSPCGYLVAGKAEQAPIPGTVRVSRSLYRLEGSGRHAA
jgi:chemotaxis protein methyltransferase CheR